MNQVNSRIPMIGGVYFLVLFLVVTGNCFEAFCQHEVDDAYKKVAYARAGKIVDNLALNDQRKAEGVQSIIANQYIQLNAIDGERNRKLSALTAVHQDNEEWYGEEKERIELDIANQLNDAHSRFLAALRRELDSLTIDRVKDGITYQVVPITYHNYLEMLPTLTTAQKQHIYSLLVEAREIAMDKGSSEGKHAVFGKYKGKINNYLSAEGVETNEARRVWEAKLRERQRTDGKE